MCSYLFHLTFHGFPGDLYWELHTSSLSWQVCYWAFGWWDDVKKFLIYHALLLGAELESPFVWPHLHWYCCWSHWLWTLNKCRSILWGLVKCVPYVEVPRVCLAVSQDILRLILCGRTLKKCRSKGDTRGWATIWKYLSVFIYESLMYDKLWGKRDDKFSLLC